MPSGTARRRRSDLVELRLVKLTLGYSCVRDLYTPQNQSHQQQALEFEVSHCKRSSGNTSSVAYAARIDKYERPLIHFDVHLEKALQSDRTNTLHAYYVLHCALCYLASTTLFLNFWWGLALWRESMLHAGCERAAVEHALLTIHHVHHVCALYTTLKSIVSILSRRASWLPGLAT
jgi:hypothetical protein